MVDDPTSMTPGIVVTRTPLRVSFAGGATDFPAFYERDYGAVLNTAIDKYLYVTVKRHSELFGELIRLNYSETEQVDRIDDIRNDIARECLRFLRINPPIYISTVADIPGSSGLGSSASFAVGLLNALHAFRGEQISVAQLAEEAAYIEMEVLKRPVGKQDHYAAAFGGLNFFIFKSNGSVSVEPQRRANGGLDSLFTNIMMFWTGVTRDAGTVLAEQQTNTPQKISELTEMRSHAHRLQDLMLSGYDPATFGAVLDETWQLKRQLASGIANHSIDDAYSGAKEAGALGGKLCGAGGGGFLLFLVPPERQPDVREALQDLVEMPVAYEPNGSRLLMPHKE
jgi:D-glycero-alpha-D-manno-heptose-7-phosphate kinase